MCVCVGILLDAVYNKVPNLTPELRLIYYSEHYANVIRCHIFTMYNLHHWLTFFVFLCLFNSFLLANSSIFFSVPTRNIPSVVLSSLCECECIRIQNPIPAVDKHRHFHSHTVALFRANASHLTMNDYYFVQYEKLEIK